MSRATIKVLHILGAPGIGGIEKLVLDLSRSQIASSTLSCGILFIREGRGEFRQQYESLGVPVYSTGVISGKEISYRKWLSAKSIFENYDVLHIHAFNPLICFAAASTGKKILYTEHGSFSLGRKTGLMGALKSRLKSWFLKRFVDSITYNSEFTRQTASRLYHLGRTDGRVIYNGMEVGRRKPEPDHCARELEIRLAGNFIVGTSSRFAAVKRIDRLVRGFAEYQAGKDTLLLLVGDGPCRAELEILADKLGIRDKVIFTGYQINVQPYQALMDVCVIASCGEAFGLVAIELLALGKVVLVFADGGGLVEVVRGYSADYIVDDVAGLAQHLNDLYASPEAVAEQGELRAAYAANFDIEVMNQEFQDEYNKLTKCAV